MIKIAFPIRGSVLLSGLPALASMLLLLSGSAYAESWKLEEPDPLDHVYEISTSLKFSGKTITAQRGGNASSMDLTAQASMKFQERRLTGAGRDAEAFRSLRVYETAESTINVHQHETKMKLRENRKKIVAIGQREGVKFYSPDGPLRYAEIQLLNTSGDILALQSLLPVKEVSLDDEWESPGWAVQMLCNTEAVLKNEMTCTLKSVENKTARVEFTGQVEGATLGASTEIEISGFYLFDLENSLITHVELTEKEKRSVGAVSPGIDIKAEVVLDRKRIETPDSLSDSKIESIPLEPEKTSYLLEFKSPWNIKFLYDRNWHIYYQSNEFAVMRLMEKGSLVAQCNLAPIASVAPGSHTEEQVFQNDIRTNLGEKLTSIEKAEQVKTDDGRYLYRVTAIGEVNELKMEWVYYLCASPTGQQVSFVFAYERDQKEKLSNRDLDLVKNLSFLDDKVPEEAAQ